MATFKKLIEVKYFVADDGRQPDHYRRVNCWLDDSRSDCLLACRVGSEGWFEFVDNFCPRFLGKYPAVITDRVPTDKMERARIEPYVRLRDRR